MSQPVSVYYIPAAWQDRTCSFCGDSALAGFSMDGGCTCRPDDFYQDLCLHHIVRANPLGSMELEVDYTSGGEFTAWWNAGMPSPLRTGT